MISTAGGTLELASRGARVQVPLGDIAGLEVGRGVDRGRGMRRGAWVGGALGLVGGLAWRLGAEDCTTDFFTGERTCRPSSVPVTLGAGVLVGAAAGALIGTRMGSERWEAVETPRQRAAVRLVPWASPAGHVGVAVVLR